MSSLPARAHVAKTFGELVKLLPANEALKPQILLVAGGVQEFRNDTDREIIFRQESNFFYLTGCNVPSSVLLAVYQAGTSLEAAPTLNLFIPKAEPEDIMWSVPPPSLTEANSLFDATTIDHPASLGAVLDTTLKAFPTALVHTVPKGSPQFPHPSASYIDQILAVETAAVTDAYLLPALHRARLTKDAYEVSQIRQANQISSRAHETVMRVLGQAVIGKIRAAKEAGVERPLLPSEWLIETEAEAEAIFIASCRREGSIHQAYPPIVAASSRASTLHYCCNDKAFAWGPIKPHDHLNRASITDASTPNKEFVPQVLLIDAGCEWNNYASDITRTMPVGNGGRFTKEAKEIYELVLAMQQASFDILKPGVHWDAIHQVCHHVLVRGFQRLGIFKSPETSTSANSFEAILASGAPAAFFPHGVGHSLGLDVHDVPSASKPGQNTTIPEHGCDHESFYKYLRLRLPVQEGMVVTVEPGIYFSPHLLAAIRDSPHINHDVLARYEPVGGIRIEDVVHITPTGYENLTTVRSDVEWVESVCSGAV